MVRIVIHQSYFLPWLGYFSKLCYADKFILLDDSKFSKGGYQDRTKYVATDGIVRWLSIPIGQNFETPSNKIEIKDKSFTTKLIKTIEHSYARADFYLKNWPDLKEILTASIYSCVNLVDLNRKIIEGLLKYLSIPKPEIYLSSEIAIETKNKESIIELCKAVGGDNLIVGDGSSLQIHDLKKIEKNGIKVFIQSYYKNHPIYKQMRRKKAGFAKGLSIIDCILNIGKENTLLLLLEEKNKPTELIQMQQI